MNNEFDKYFFNDTKKMINNMDSLISKLKTIRNNDTNIPNIAITYNNKLVELLHIYKDNNVKFNGSELILLIHYHLLNIINESMFIIFEYIKIYKDIGKYAIKLKKSNLLHRREYREKILELLNQSNKLLEIIIDKDNEIFHFDIEKYIDYLNSNHSELEELLKKAGDKTTIDDIIDNCNIDILALGYKKTIKNVNRNPQLNEKHKNKINVNFDIDIIATDKLTEIMSRYDNYLNISEALETLLFDYLGEAVDAYYKGDYDLFIKIKNKIKNINIKEDLIEGIGKLLATTKVIDEEDGKRHLIEIKKELISLNLLNLYPIIEKDYINDKYIDYINTKNMNLKVK